MSIRVFRDHMLNLPNGEVDASQVVSIECYQAFLLAKASSASDHEAKKFYRVLTTHLSGVDGRRAFKKNEEEAILRVLRRNEDWPCMPPHLHLGSGFRGKGFHEKQHGTREPTSWRKKPKLGHNLPLEEEETKKGEEFAQTLAQNIISFSASLMCLGVDFWKTVLGACRFMVLVKTGAILGTVTGECAEQLCMRTDLEVDSMQGVMVLNMLRQGDFTKRVLAQNRKGVEMFGSLVGKHDTMLMQKEDLFSIAMAIGQCYSRPGKAYETKQKIACVDGVVRPHRLRYVCDLETYLLVVCVSEL